MVMQESAPFRLWPCRPWSPLSAQGDLLAGGYSVSVKFDDSIIEDKNAEINQGIALVGAQLMSKRKFMVDTLGYTPEAADAEIALIAKENQMNVRTVDNLFGTMT